MAISRSIKQERGYGVTGYDLYQEISEFGVRPPLGPTNDRAAPWLPVLLQDQRSNEWFTLLAGRMVAQDNTLTEKDEYGNAYSTNPYRLVPCNSSGSAQPITYTSSDVNYTVDVDDNSNLVTAAGTATATLPANYPIGWCYKNVYSDAIRYRYLNYDKDLHISVLCDYYIEVALIGLSGQSSLAPGRLVKPYAGTGAGDSYQGCPTLWDPSSDSVEQIGGRVTTMGSIPSGTSSRSRLDLVKAVRGLSLPGKDTTGKPQWLALDQATHWCRINICLMS